jgi:hypothetical protein
MAAWGPKPAWLTNAIANAPLPPPPTLTTTVNVVPYDVSVGGGVTYSQLRTEGKKSGGVILSSAFVGPAHDGLNKVTYWCPPAGTASTYPHITVLHTPGDQGGTILSVHYSASSGASLWFNVGVTRLSGSTAFWTISATARNTAKTTLKNFLFNANISKNTALDW